MHLKHLLLLFSFSLAGTLVNAQSTTEKTLTEICGCVKKTDLKLSEDKQTAYAIGCLASGVEKNILALKKENAIQTESLEAAAQELASKLGMQLISQCPEILPYIMKYAQEQNATAKQADIDTDTLKLDPKVCGRYKSGKYKKLENYINGKLLNNSDPGAYSEVKEGFLYEYSQNNSYTTKWSIRWFSDCEWEQTLIETSEPNLKSVMKKGDKLTMKAIGSTASGKLWVSSQFLGMEFLMLLSPVK